MKALTSGSDGKSLWKSLKKFVNNAAKVYESHWNSLWTMRQKFMKVTAKVCEQTRQNGWWKPRQEFVNNDAKFYKNHGKVCEDGNKSLWMTTPKLLQEIAAEVILMAEVMPSSNACLALITDFVPYRWNAAENYKCFSLRNYKSESHSHKGCPNKEARKPKCANCNPLRVASYKGCPEYKKQAF